MIKKALNKNDPRRSSQILSNTIIKFINTILTNTICTVTKSRNMNTTHWQDNDIYQFITLPAFCSRSSRQFQRRCQNNALQLHWKNISNFQVSINGKKIGRTIDSLQEAYIVLHQTLHRNYEQMLPKISDAFCKYLNSTYTNIPISSPCAGNTHFLKPHSSLCCYFGGFALTSLIVSCYKYFIYMQICCISIQRKSAHQACLTWMESRNEHIEKVRLCCERSVAGICYPYLIIAIIILIYTVAWQFDLIFDLLLLKEEFYFENYWC